jgi:predicted GNAT family N-acyltransferase
MTRPIGRRASARTARHFFNPEDLKLTVDKGALQGSALEFRRRVYEKEQGTAGLDSFDEKAVHLVARDCGNAIVASARIVLPEQRPFALEAYFDLERHLPSGYCPSEIGRYCVREDWREVRRGTFLHLGMLKLSLAYARMHDIQGFVCSVQPHLQSFYQRIHFTQIGLTFNHSDYGHTTVMWLDLRDVCQPQAGAPHPLLALLQNPKVPRVTL